jgi:hypothetical protein
MTPLALQLYRAMLGPELFVDAARRNSLVPRRPS